MCVIEISLSLSRVRTTIRYARSSAGIAELEADRACHPIRGCQIQAMLPRRWFRRRASAPAATTPRRPPEREFSYFPKFVQDLRVFGREPPSTKGAGRQERARQ